MAARRTDDVQHPSSGDNSDAAVDRNDKIERIEARPSIEVIEVEAKSRSYHERRTAVTKLMGATCHCIFVSFSIYVLYLSFKTLSLFSWHPACMTLGSLLLMAEAVMAMSPGSYVPANFGRQGRVRVHWILQAGAVLLIFAGFLVIVINKNRNNKIHFQSLHAISGLVFFIFVSLTSIGGVATLYSYNLKECIKPVWIKMLHNAIGIITFILGVFTVVLGIYTGWFTKNSTLSAQLMCTVSVVLGGIFSLENAVKSVYARYLTMCQTNK